MIRVISGTATATQRTATPRTLDRSEPGPYTALMIYFSRNLAWGWLTLLASCSALKDDGPELVKGTENSPEGPTYLIGLVELVNPEQRFVLVRTEGAVKIPLGDQIITLDATGAQAKLKVTPERKQNFLTADIIEGQPKVGNLVIHRPGQQAAKPAPPAPPTAESGAAAPAVDSEPAPSTIPATPTLDAALSPAPGSLPPLPPRPAEEPGSPPSALPPVIR